MAEDDKGLEAAREFGDLVRQRRELKGMTQKQLGDRAGVDQSYISRIENGDRVNIGSITMGRLQAALDADLGATPFWKAEVEAFLATEDGKALKVTPDERRRMLRFQWYEAGEAASHLAWVDYIRALRGVTREGARGGGDRGRG